MIEIPEAITLAKQLTDSLNGKKVERVIVAQNPHKWAWYYKDPADYSKRLIGNSLGDARAFGSFVEVDVGSASLLFSEGVRLRFIDDAVNAPKKHQLYLEFSDSSALTASIQMYGGLYCYSGDEFDNKYFTDAKTLPSPLSTQFDEAYFERMVTAQRDTSVSAKGFLATEQRIPGLGNGVLRDILFNARIHPKRKLSSISDSEVSALFGSIKATLKAMADGGGRDVEKDLYGNDGGYATKLSRNTLGLPCLECSTPIEKASYMGGAVYFCPECQTL